MLNPSVKSTMFATTPGNHDFWMYGRALEVDTEPSDQYGNGFLQWYAQDSIAAKDDPSQPFNLSIAPACTTCKAGVCDCTTQKADASNFFHYSILGNVGLLTYSGAHPFEPQEAWFGEACDYFADASPQPEHVLLISHFSDCENGACCTAKSTGKGSIPGCSATQDMDVYSIQTLLQTSARFAGGPCARAMGAMGHTHCNSMKKYSDMAAPIFQLGGMGMSSAACSETSDPSEVWGFGLLDTTTKNEARLIYFPFALPDDPDQDDVRACLKAHGGNLDACVASYGKQWWPVPTTTSSPANPLNFTHDFVATMWLEVSYYEGDGPSQTNTFTIGTYTITLSVDVSGQRQRLDVIGQINATTQVRGASTTTLTPVATRTLTLGNTQTRYLLSSGGADAPTCTATAGTRWAGAFEGIDGDSLKWTGYNWWQGLPSLAFKGQAECTTALLPKTIGGSCDHYSWVSPGPASGYLNSDRWVGAGGIPATWTASGGSHTASSGNSETLDGHVVSVEVGRGLHGSSVFDVPAICGKKR